MIIVLTQGAALSLMISGASPFVAAVSFLATFTVKAAMGVGMAIGMVSLFRRRWFCRWLCPMGICADAASWVGRSLGRHSRPGVPWGQWLVWLTLGGALFGYPLFLWLDPLSLWSGVFLPKTQINTLAAWGPPLGFGLLMLLTGWWPHIWCARACPLGALQDLLRLSAKAVYSAISRVQKQPVPIPRRTGKPIARRALLGMALGTAGAAAVNLSKTLDAQTLRPPGAVSNPIFSGLCTRCGNCIRSCPSHIITRDLGPNGWTGFLTPTLDMDLDYCREECVACTQVCPSGALSPVSLEHKAHTKIGLARVDMDICLLKDDRECSACRRWCPYDAIHYVFSNESYTTAPVINAEKCTGCGACQAYCPTQPHKAIVIHRL